MYNPAIHKRRSIRLKTYDYSSQGLYFITLCCTDRINIFGKITDGEMHLNPFGLIAAKEWLNTSEIRKNISLGEYIIMPNHIHGIISIDYKIKETEKKDIGKFKSPSQTIGAIIRGYKGATTKKINNLIQEIKGDTSSTGELQFAPTEIAPTENLAPIINQLPEKGSIWQRNYYENIIRTKQAYTNISNYIINNPKNWEEDRLR